MSSISQWRQNAIYSTFNDQKGLPQGLSFPFINTLDYYASLISSCTILGNLNCRQTSPFTMRTLASSSLNELPKATGSTSLWLYNKLIRSNLSRGIIHALLYPAISVFPQYLESTFSTLTSLTHPPILTSSQYPRLLSLIPQLLACTALKAFNHFALFHLFYT